MESTSRPGTPLRHRMLDDMSMRKFAEHTQAASSWAPSNRWSVTTRCTTCSTGVTSSGCAASNTRSGIGRGSTHCRTGTRHEPTQPSVTRSSSALDLDEALNRRGDRSHRATSPRPPSNGGLSFR